MAPAEILTDTMGVDFGPYMTRMVQVIKQNWIIGLFLPSAYPPIWKAGKDVYRLYDPEERAGQRNGVAQRFRRCGAGPGSVGEHHESNPLPPLPKEFPGPNLGLRLNFYLNMNIDDVK